MIRQPVISNDINSIGYENGVLEIAFSSGRIYQYSDVPCSIYDSLMSANSHGEYFHNHIKDIYSKIKLR